jgi:hypothetical protein
LVETYKFNTAVHPSLIFACSADIENNSANIESSTNKLSYNVCYREKAQAVYLSWRYSIAVSKEICSLLSFI